MEKILFFTKIKTDFIFSVNQNKCITYKTGVLINEMLFYRTTGGTADVPGTAQFSRECLEVEDSLQNAQKIKRTSQVVDLLLTVK